MKKFSLSILFGIISILSIYASSEIDFPIIDLKCYNKRPADGIDQLGPRTLVSSPVVYLNNHNLIFETAGFCHSVTLIDVQTEEVVYETIVTESTTQISIPAYLEGEYEVRFNCDRYYYSGIIELGK